MHVVLEIRIALPPSIPPATSQSCSWGSCCLSVNPFPPKERRKKPEERTARGSAASEEEVKVGVRDDVWIAYPPWTTTSPLQMP